MNAIEVRALRKVYRSRLRGSKLAVDGLTMAVPSGSVFGFLGPNGSGKTTTIRCLLGLAAPTEGSCRMLGQDVPSRLDRVIGKVGSVVEAPAFFGRFSGRRHLEVLARAAGLPRARVDEVLDRVGLGSRGDDAIKGYSLGMRQRLALAAVLLKDPQLLILDEPGNGLDPAGLKEVRDLLRSLAREGRTVFLSSHLLQEIQLICDSVAIIQRGRCIAAGPVAEVIASRGAAALVVRLPNTRRIKTAARVLTSAGYPVELSDDHLLVAASAEQGSEINKLLAQEGIYLSELRAEELSLESVFLELTGGESV
ncbi:MAG TPA: ABC transporter ATP-binding protein [Actinomycetota bacterium]|nr:ABC transporter ATP-binding protein [Actinomycetota bacterium]